MNACLVVPALKPNPTHLTCAQSFIILFWNSCLVDFDAQAPRMNVQLEGATHSRAASEF